MFTLASADLALGYSRLSHWTSNTRHAIGGRDTGMKLTPPPMSAFGDSADTH
ncbi:MAG: hypothetical protein AAFO63_00590 [Pseudomonadota bacterium]